MQLSTIEMPVAEAKAALDEWADAKMRERSEEDDAIAAGYRALSEGRALISLSETIRAGGEDAGFKPRLAVAPVRADTIYLTRSRSGNVRFSVSDNPRGIWTSDICSRGVELHGIFPEVRWQDRGSPDPEIAARYDRYERSKVDGNRWGGCCWRAMVPVVPPRFRVRGWRGAFVLFEAEWAEHTPPAPVDPALIQHLRGDLFVVLGVWDLTPLERAVLTERNR
jgi:hypothetical protein